MQGFQTAYPQRLLLGQVLLNSRLQPLQVRLDLQVQWQPSASLHACQPDSILGSMSHLVIPDEASESLHEHHML